MIKGCSLSIKCKSDNVYSNIKNEGVLDTTKWLYNLTHAELE